jgi:hypothetical protein
MRVRSAAAVASLSSVVLLALTSGTVCAQGLNYEVVGDGIPKPLTATPGSAARGKALLVKREAANCLKCLKVTRKSRRK